MTFRTRLLAGFGVVVLVPLAVFGLGIRREMSGRVAAEYERRVGALADVIRADVARQSDGIAARLAALKGALAADNRFRVAAIQGGDRAYVLDYAGDAMRLTGLDFLQVLDDEGRVVSSGHFRNEFDRPAPLPPPGGPALVSAESVRASARNWPSAVLGLRTPPRSVNRRPPSRSHVAIFHNNLGTALEKTGHFTAAAEAYRAALAVEGTYGPAATNLSRVEQLKEDPAAQPVDLAALAKTFVDQISSWNQ